MRTEKSLKNVLFGWGMQLVIIVLGFICRTVFIEILGEEYLGLSGLFANILTMLSLRVSRGHVHYASREEGDLL